MDQSSLNVPDFNKCAPSVLNSPFFFFLLFTDDFPKPQITVQPETQSALKGTNVTFICSAASSSDSPMTFAWKKDNEVLNDAEIHNQAHLRVQAGAGGETEVTEYTTTLQLRNVEFSSEGKYQCVISNHFGSSYSTKARLTVNSKLEMGKGILLSLQDRSEFNFEMSFNSNKSFFGFLRITKPVTFLSVVTKPASS